MFTPDLLINAFARNLHFIKTHTAGFTQADSLRQPPFKGNCANWIVGHIALYRNTILEHLLQAAAIDPVQAQRYKAGSEPVLGDEPGLATIDAIIAALETAQARIAAGLPALTPERGAEMIKFGTLPNPISRAETMIFLLRHEAYHTGQLEILAEMVKSQ
jgi:uncharacterized damage-inducible protein DinB